MAIIPCAASTARSIRVEGGQIRISTSGGAALTEAAIARISPSWAFRPCIFQFPATKGRMAIQQRVTKSVIFGRACVNFP